MAKAKDPYQLRIKDKVLEKHVDTCIEDVKKELGDNTRGAQSIALERLLQKSFDEERRFHEEFRRLAGVVSDLRKDVAELRSQLTGLREDFGYCLRSLVVVAQLVDKTTADKWFDEYYRTGKMNDEG